MWELEYADEVKFYFLDNYPYTFELLVKIEELKFIEDGMPLEGDAGFQADYHWWRILSHTVIYRIFPDRRTIRILVVKPND
jgi:hypothetical protein